MQTCHKQKKIQTSLPILRHCIENVIECMTSDEITITYWSPEAYIFITSLLSYFRCFAFIATVNFGFLAGRQALKHISVIFLRTVCSETFTLASCSCDFIIFLVANQFSTQMFFKHLSDLGVKMDFLPHLCFRFGLKSPPASIFFFMHRTLASETFNLRGISRFENVLASTRLFTSAFFTRWQITCFTHVENCPRAYLNTAHSKNN